MSGGTDSSVAAALLVEQGYEVIGLTAHMWKDGSRCCSLEDVARALDSLTLSDVKPASEQPGEKVGTSVFTLTDGMTVTVTVFRADTEVWAQFQAAGEGEAKAKADALNARIAGWAYQLGSWKEKSFVPKLEERKADEPEKPAEGEKKESE